MNARRVPRAPERHDVPDLGEREAHAAGLRHKREQPQHIDRIVTVAGRRAARRRQNPPRFVQPQRLGAEPASRRDLSDEEVVALHDRQHRPCPLGQGQAQFDAELFKSLELADLGAGHGSTGSGSCMVAGSHCMARKLMEGPMEPVDVNSIREAVRVRRGIEFAGGLIRVFDRERGRSRSRLRAEDARRDAR